MKTNFVILLLGITSVIANTDELPKDQSHLKVEDTDITKQDDQENITESDMRNELTEKYDDAQIDIIEESIESTPNDFMQPPLEATANFIPPEVPSLEDVTNEFIAPEPPTLIQEEPPIFNPYVEDNVILKEPGEIMETAAGFVPIPIIRNRQKQRRRFVTRRNFQRYPFKRFHFFYAYPFYQPSSLRYYRF